jgi:hypothetical protein
MAGQQMNFVIEDENLPELLKRIRPPEETTVEEIQIKDRRVKYWVPDQLVDIRDLLPDAKMTAHLFIRPAAVNFMAIEAVPQIAVPANRIVKPN